MADLRRALRRRRAAELTVDPLIDAVGEFAGAVADSVGKRYNLANSRAEKHLRTYMSERVGMINTTTRETIHEALKPSSLKRRGETERQAVRRVFEAARANRAPMIAQGEIDRASNWAAIDAGKWVGELDRKRWASQDDEKVRHEHQRPLHGQVVGWNEDFTSAGGYKGPAPGQMTGGASMNAACRCAAIPAKRGVLADNIAGAVDLYNGLREPFVQEMEASWRRVFDEQEAAVLAEIG